MQKKQAFIGRKVADKNIQLLLQVVAKMNDIESKKEDCPHRIKNVVIFGSYLSDKRIIGDIDLFIELESKWQDKKAEMDFFYHHREGIRSYFERMTTSDYLTMKMLRCKKKSFSFHDMYEMADLIQVNPSLNYKYIVKNFKILQNENDK